MLAQMLKAGCRSVAMEVSSHALDQRRTRGIDFDAAVFTNLTRDHLDYHVTREAYFEAKRRLFTGLTPGRGRAIINTDDPWGRKLASDPEVRAPVLTYGLDAGADVRGEIRELSSRGSSVVVRGPWGECGMTLRLLGRFNVMNALAAVSCASVLGIEPDTAVRTLATLTSVRGRMEQVPCGGGFSVFVDYAHTDDALQNVLTTVRELGPRRIILVFGCGGNRDRTKRPAMGLVASELADHVIVTSDNPRDEDPREIIGEIEAGMTGAAGRDIVDDRRAAIAMAIRMAGEDDVVLIAGKGHETFQETAGRTVAFDDRRVASEELRRVGL
jgi:UDP-N-acetylmuramoyl-L-alanyl-D-glutamate--2,6-diaminopimelate ligase